VQKGVIIGDRYVMSVTRIVVILNSGKISSNKTRR